MKVSIPLLQRKEHDRKDCRGSSLCSAPIESKKIIVVDSWSQEGAQAVLEGKASRMVDQVIYHPVSRGKGRFV